MGSPSPEIPFVSHLHPSLSLSGVTVTIASFIAGTPMYLDFSAFSFHVPLKQSSVISRFLHDLVHAGCGTGIARRPTHPPVLLRRKILLWSFGNALGNCWALTHVWGSYALSVQAMNLKSAYQEENRDVDRKPRSPRGVLTRSC